MQLNKLENNFNEISILKIYDLPSIKKSPFNLIIKNHIQTDLAVN